MRPRLGKVTTRTPGVIVEWACRLPDPHADMETSSAASSTTTARLRHRPVLSRRLDKHLRFCQDRRAHLIDKRGTAAMHTSLLRHALGIRRSGIAGVYRSGAAA